jgi:3-isopropylmalate/(R)-2-methylmalate dehydratase large subunit
MGKSLLDKVWDIHQVKTCSNGQSQIFIGLHLLHEVTSPQAFEMIRGRGLKVLFPSRTFATVDHIVPTEDQSRPFKDGLAEEMITALENNTRESGIKLFDLATQRQGVIHVVGPELGLTQPGMTIACGDSHTSTHGAFGALAFGVGTSQIRDILATQTMMMSKPKLRKIVVTGKLGKGVFAKDVILAIIRKLGVNGGIGFCYEYAGEVIERMSMEERLCICNMTIEGGARMGYINPDETTFAYLKGREYAFDGDRFEKAVRWWKTVASDPDAHYDDVVTIDGSALEPMVTWGINPGQAVGVGEDFPRIESMPESERATAKEAYEYMSFEPGKPVQGTPVNVAFIGSCTNGRLSDLREAAKVAKGRKVSRSVRALVVPGSQAVAREAEKEGLDKIFREAGFEWRAAGCSMCLAMNPDKLSGREICASSSNRNFKGRQGSASGRTILMSPAMVAAAAVSGKIIDVRELL